MPRALIFAPTCGFRDASYQLRLQETVHALHGGGWGADIVACGGRTPLEDGETRTFSPPALLRPLSVPLKPSLRAIYAARLMFLRALPLVSSGAYDVFHGYDDGAYVARAVRRAMPKKHPVVAEYRFPVSTVDGPVGMWADISRRREQAVMRQVDAVVLPCEAMAARFEKPPQKARLCIIPDAQSETNVEFFTVSEFEEAILRVYEFAVLSSRGRVGIPEDEGR